MCKMIISIICVIVGISVFVAIIAFVSDCVAQKKDGTINGISHKCNGPYERFIKRPLDCFFATLVLIVLGPFLILIAITVRIKVGAPVLFVQERPGKNTKIFKLYKFRSMTEERDENCNLLPNEKRLTPFGRKLRATSIDELPELLNIIKGDMSIIGPRPLLVRYIPYYTSEERKRHDVRPGLTGLAQVTNNGNLNWDDKLQMDVAYCENITFLNDLTILIKTVVAVFTRGDTVYDGYDPLDVERMKKRGRK